MANSPPGPQQRPKGSRRLQYAAAFSATLSHVTLGAFVGWAAPLLPRLLSEISPLPTTQAEASWIVSASSLSMVFPLFFVGHLADTVGRKTMLLCATVPHVTLWTIQMFSTAPWQLILSRVIGAWGHAIILVTAPCYLTEIAELEIRGTLISICQMMMSLGVLVVYSVAPYVWFETLAAMLLSIPTLLVATLPWMPESPTFLLLRGRHHEAQQSLARLRGMKNFEDVQEELAAMKRAVVERRASGTLVRIGYREKIRELLYDPVNRRTLLLTSVLQALMHWCGYLVMMTYATTFFKLTGSKFDPNLSSITLAAIQVTTSVVAFGTVEWFHTRKTPLVVCMTGNCLALFTEGLYFFLKDDLHADVSNIGWLPLAAHGAFVIFHTLGPGALILTVNGEIFLPRVKGVALSCLVLIRALSGFTTLKLYLLLTMYFSLCVTFWTFAVISALGAFFVWRFLPETKGRRPEEVALEIAGRLQPA